MKDVYVAKEGKKEKDEKAQEEVLDEENSNNDPPTTYGYRPPSIKFETQEKGEEIILFLRQHPILNVSWIAITILLAAAPILLTFFPIFNFLPARFQFIGILAWYLFVLAFSLEKFLNWLFDVYIVTDRRIVDVDFFDLINKQVSETSLDKIQDTTFRLGGLFGTLFNYGDVLIQTAGTVPNFEFENVPSPGRVVKTLEEVRDKRKESDGV